MAIRDMRFYKAWAAHAPLLRTGAILLTLIVAASWLLSVVHSRNSGTTPLQAADWQWAPAASYEESQPPASGWQPYTPGTVIPSNVYWLRMPLPNDKLDDPHLKVTYVGSLRAFDGDNEIFSFVLTGMKNWMSIAYHWKLVPLPVPMPDHVDLLIRYKEHLPVSAEAVLGSKSALIDQMLRTDMDNLLLGVLLLFCGGFSIGLYVSHRNRLYSYFSLLALCGGYASLVRNHLLQVIIDIPALSYFQDVCMPIGTYAFIGALTQVFPDVYRRTNRLLRHVTLTNSLIVLLGVFINDWLYTAGMFLFTPTFLVVFIASYLTIWTAYRRRRDLESAWIMAGFSLLAGIALLHMYRYILISFLPARIQEWTAWIHHLPNDLLFLGIFAFVVCLVRVIIYHYMGMHRQLLEFNRSLEHIVSVRTQEIVERTAELERTHVRLDASMRENAEALAETMIMEERHRITGSIHETVGDTLSSTIHQLGVAKRLLRADPAQAEQHLEVSQTLLRKGLDGIRRSVRLLREDAGHFDLYGAIGAMIRETESTTSNCTFDKQLDPLPEQLSSAYKRLLFQAVHEGISMGLKQDPPARTFKLSIWHDEQDGSVQFLLSFDNDKSASDWSVGLRSLTEQANRLSVEWNAENTGSEQHLRLSIPLTSNGSNTSWVI